MTSSLVERGQRKLKTSKTRLLKFPFLCQSLSLKPYNRYVKASNYHSKIINYADEILMLLILI